MWFKKIIFTLCLFLISFSLAYSNSVVEVNSNNLLSIIANSKGKVLIVNFWASWCPYCKKETKELTQLREQYDRNKLEILGISFDSSKHNFTHFLKKYKINYPCYLASDSRISMMFNVYGIPATIVYDKDGRVAKQFPGYVEIDELKKIIDGLISK
ncbi:TlpA disulfide reductase family protein [Desulfothermus naphthae]